MRITAMQRQAAVQEARVARSQLREIGWSRDEIDGQLRRRYLTAEHRGVYVVGCPPWTLKGALWSAVLACGPGSVVSHGSAAYLRGYLRCPPSLDHVHVTVTSGAPRRRPGIALHHARNLAPSDIEEIDGLLVTSTARTLLDLAASASDSEFEEAFDEAVFRRRARRAEIESILARNPGAKGSRRLRELWEAEVTGERNRREAEKRMAALIRNAKLPRPRPNAPIGPYTVDFLWPDHRVIVEIDGFATHRKRRSFEADRARDADLGSQGYAVVRFTWRQIVGEPYVVVARLAARLALGRR